METLKKQFVIAYKCQTLSKGVEAVTQALESLNLFSRNLRKLRRDRGLTQDALAKKIGKTHATIHRFETGELDPKSDHLEQLARALNCHVNDFFKPETRRMS